jgi:hypothetical protein
LRVQGHPGIYSKFQANIERQANKKIGLIEWIGKY